MGTGAIANDFAQALKTSPGAVLHAAASRSQASADAFAKKHGIARSFGSYTPGRVNAHFFSAL